MEKMTKKQVVRECSFVERDCGEFVSEKYKCDLSNIYTVESKGKSVLFGLNEEFVGVKEELRCLKKFVEELLGRVDLNPSQGLGLGQGNFGLGSSQYTRHEKDKVKMDLGQTGPPRPKMGGI